MIRKGWLAACLVILVAGCSTEAERSAIWAKASKLRAAPDYLIGEGDVLTVRVLGEGPDFTVTNQVRPDGRLSFPKYGDIDATGKTAEALRAELEQGFAEKLALKSPKVFVAVNSFFSKNVSVFGEVRVAGRFPYIGQMRVLDLLGLAVGYDDIQGDLDDVLLFREVDNTTKIYHVDLEAFFKRGDFSTNFYLRPGDVLYVPKNGFATVATWITKVTLPLNAIFSVFGLGTSTVSYFVPSPASTGALGGFGNG
jgi:polysaccharide export outer membrane protein